MNEPQMKRPDLPLRERLFRLQYGLCWICCKPMTLAVEHEDGATIDHVVPLARGGANRPGNKLLAHKRCNSTRGAPQPTQKLHEIIDAALRRIREQVSASDKP